MTPKCPDCKRDQDDCVCVDPQERIKELEREIERKMSAAAFVLKERDALQADNARLREALDKACIRIEENGFEVGEHWKTGRQALAATPEQSLAAYRDAEIAKLKEDLHFQACLTKYLMPYQERAVLAEKERDQLREQVKMLRDAIEKIADNHGSYGPFPEANNPLWGPMAIVTAREALAATEVMP